MHLSSRRCYHARMKILVVDDHPLILEALHHVLRQLQADVEVLGAVTADEGRRLAALNPELDLLLLDLNLPGADGFALLEELRRSYPALPVVVLSASEQPEDVVRALDMGAMGYIPKTSSNEVMLQALRLVFSGGIYVPRAAIAESPPEPVARPRAPATSTITPHELGLTDRQAEVLAALLQGLPNKLICRKLDLAEGTVKIHVAAILRALGVHTRTQAVIQASRLGLTVDAMTVRPTGTMPPGETRP
jgi:DNA-binding NarL/FixJ family response regulator